MQSNKHNPVAPPVDQGGGSYFCNAPPGPFYGGMALPPAANPPGPFRGVEVQPSEACPKNFIIFDCTDNRSKIMFHPAVGSHMSYPAFTSGAPPFRDNFERNNAFRQEKEIPSFVKEDSEDIDALLSLEAEDSEESSDEEEVSTARTDANCGSSSPESCSNYASHPRKKCRQPPSFKKSTASCSSSNGRKRQKMKKMVKALQGIIPGADQMNTVAVLDEAVRYLKSLKMEVQKLGVGNHKSYI